MQMPTFIEEAMNSSSSDKKKIFGNDNTISELKLAIAIERERERERAREQLQSLSYESYILITFTFMGIVGFMRHQVISYDSNTCIYECANYMYKLVKQIPRTVFSSFTLLQN